MKNETTLRVGITPEKIEQYHIPRWEELPTVDLYVDQVIQTVDNIMGIFAHVGEDKLLTKSMVNNYVKQGIIAPPEGKKYNRDQIACLTLVCFLKKILSISEISHFISDVIKDNRINDFYNFFCDKLESALCLIFCSDKFIDRKAGIKDVYNMDVVHAATFAYANKVCLQNLLIGQTKILKK